MISILLKNAFKSSSLLSVNMVYLILITFVCQFTGVNSSHNDLFQRQFGGINKLFHASAMLVRDCLRYLSYVFSSHLISICIWYNLLH